jgi:hypothetical protein
MHPSARAGYIWLLLDSWQTDDCTIPSDTLDLAEKSGLGDELWAIHGPRILRKFDPVNGTGRLRNQVCFEKWQEAKAIYEGRHVSPEELSRKRSEAGKKGNQKRWATRNLSQTDRKCDIPESQIATILSQTDRYTETVTSTETKTSTNTKTLPAKRKASQVDERFALFKSDFDKAYEFMNHIPAPWDAKEATNLSRWLKKNPTASRAQWQNILQNRKRSPINHAAELSRWINSAFSWLEGPADEWGKKINGNGRSYGRNASSIEAIREYAAGSDGRTADDQKTVPTGLFDSSRDSISGARGAIPDGSIRPDHEQGSAPDGKDPQGDKILATAGSSARTGRFA